MVQPISTVCHATPQLIQSSLTITATQHAMLALIQIPLESASPVMLTAPAAQALLTPSVQPAIWLNMSSAVITGATRPAHLNSTQTLIKYARLAIPTAMSAAALPIQNALTASLLLSRSLLATVTHNVLPICTSSQPRISALVSLLIYC